MWIINRYRCSRLLEVVPDEVDDTGRAAKEGEVEGSEERQ
jgi:hypothetical protein